MEIVINQEINHFYILKFTIMKNRGEKFFGKMGEKLKAGVKIAKYASILVITLLASIQKSKANTITDKQAQQIAQTLDKKHNTKRFSKNVDKYNSAKFLNPAKKKDEAYDGDEIPPTSHKELLEKNKKYQKNYQKAEDLFFADAPKTCAKIAGEGKLSKNDSKVFLITAYYSSVNSSWTAQSKRDFLGLYFRDASWNNASAGDINTTFAKLMREARTFLRDGDASKLSMPVYIPEEDIVSVDEL